MECRETPGKRNFGGARGAHFEVSETASGNGDGVCGWVQPQYTLGDGVAADGEAVRRHPRPQRWYPPPHRQEHLRPPSQTVVGPLADLDRPEGSKLGGVRVAPATRAGAELGWAAGRTKPLGKPYSTSVECRETP